MVISASTRVTRKMVVEAQKQAAFRSAYTRRAVANPGAVSFDLLARFQRDDADGYDWARDLYVRWKEDGCLKDGR